MIVSSNTVEHSAMSHQHKTIAPKTSNFGVRNSSELVSSSTTSNPRQPASSSASCRRRIAFHPTLGYAIAPTMVPKVARRNARERNRVKQVNCGFEMLRSHIPSAAKSKKMSKVDTLRHAVEYIQNMQKMLHEQQQQQHHHQTHLPPPLHIQSPPTPLTPTPSSRASSVPSPMTPHMPPLQHQQHHFILPDVPTYPSPLTPRTPNTPASGDFMTLSNNPYPSNDSGYETSSFYSSSTSSLSPSMMSPHCHPQRPHHLQHHQHQLASSMSPASVRHLEASPVSPPVFSRPQQYHEMEVSSHFHYNNFNGIAENPEEEELLDAIAKWQEQGDE